MDEVLDVDVLSGISRLPRKEHGWRGENLLLDLIRSKLKDGSGTTGSSSPIDVIKEVLLGCVEDKLSNLPS